MEHYKVQVTYGSSVSTSETQPASADVVLSQDTGGEFEQFEDLARKLVAVPKDEIDAKREG